MAPVNLAAVALIGLLGSVHCAGMCGGIVGAFSLVPEGGRSRPRPFPVTVVTARAASSAVVPRVLAYNSGRLASYALAGIIAGSAGGAATLAGLAITHTIMAWMVNAMLVILGLHLSGAWRALSWLETGGRHLWRRLEPLTATLLPLDSLPKLVAMGALWGWLPCGMVYSVLLTAMLSGSGWQGGAIMLAFGLGTLPMLLAMGLSGMRLRHLLGKPGVRLAGGALVAAFGVAGLLRLATGGANGWLDAFCIAPLA